MNIRYKPGFVRQYKKLPQALQEEVKEKVSLFKENHKHPFLKTHKLKGHLKSFWSFSVNYDYRIVFEYEKSDTVAFLVIGNHDIYK